MTIWIITIWLSCTPASTKVLADFPMQTFRVPDKEIHRIDHMLLERTKDILVPIGCEIRYSVKLETEPK